MPTSKQRRAAEQRRLRRQAQRRQQQVARRRRMNVIMSVVGSVLVIGLVVTLIAVTSSSDDKSKASASKSPTASSTPSSTAASSSPVSSPTTKTSAAKTSSAKTSSARTSSANTSAAKTSAASAAVTTCRYPRSGTAARKVSTPPTKASAKGTVAVRLATSQGAMTFDLNRSTAPCAVNSFVSLVQQKFYDKTSCHRLVTKSIFLLQCGDPTGTGTGGPGYRFDDELGTDPVYRRGSVVMANAGPNTNGSQFFIVDRDTTLGANYTRLGTVSAGLAVLDKVYRAGTSDGSTDGPPKLPLTFRTVTVS